MRTYRRWPSTDVLSPLDVPDEIWITDTTFRDGQQSREPYTVKEMTDLFDMLHRLSSFKRRHKDERVFLYTKKDREAVYKCLEKGYKFPEITSWIRASKKRFPARKRHWT